MMMVVMVVMMTMIVAVMMVVMMLAVMMVVLTVNGNLDKSDTSLSLSKDRKRESLGYARGSVRSDSISSSVLAIIGSFIASIIFPFKIFFFFSVKNHTLRTIVSTLLYCVSLLSGYGNIDNQCRNPMNSDKEYSG